MLIKFKKPDPRAGLVARMDSSRGQQLIDAGAADKVDEAVAAPQKAVPPQEPTPETQQPAAEVAAQTVEPKQADAGAADKVDEAAKPKAARGKK